MLEVQNLEIAGKGWNDFGIPIEICILGCAVYVRAPS
jgi:hypothetical protein